ATHRVGVGEGAIDLFWCRAKHAMETNSVGVHGRKVLRGRCDRYALRRHLNEQKPARRAPNFARTASGASSNQHPGKPPRTLFGIIPITSCALESFQFATKSLHLPPLIPPCALPP